MLPEAVGLGLIISLFFAETLGLTASGLVVPGYIAINLNNPAVIIGTLLAGFLTMVIVRLIGKVILLFGRRTMVLSVIIGFLISMGVPILLQAGLGASLPDFGVIGFIISGLIGYWMVRQGVLETTCTVLMSAVIVRMILIVANGGGLIDASIL